MQLCETGARYGDVLTVKTITKDPEQHRTYNFEVADFHTYFVGTLGAWVHNGVCDWIANGATRRLPSARDAQFATAEDALAEAASRHGIDPSTIEVTKMYGKNPNLIGEQGQPWARVSGLNSKGDIVEFDLHSNGHYFEDKNEYELPHYHGPNNEHLTY